MIRVTGDANKRLFPLKIHGLFEDSIPLVSLSPSEVLAA